MVNPSLFVLNMLPDCVLYRASEMANANKIHNFNQNHYQSHARRSVASLHISAAVLQVPSVMWSGSNQLT